MNNDIKNIGVVRETRKDENRTPIVPKNIKEL